MGLCLSEPEPLDCEKYDVKAPTIADEGNPNPQLPPLTYEVASSRQQQIYEIKTKIHKRIIWAQGQNEGSVTVNFPRVFYDANNQKYEDYQLTDSQKKTRAQSVIVTRSWHYLANWLTERYPCTMMLDIKVERIIIRIDWSNHAWYVKARAQKIHMQTQKDD